MSKANPRFVPGAFVALLTTAVLWGSAHEAAARGRYGGGAAYTHTTVARPAGGGAYSRTTAVRTQPVGYNPGAYHPASPASVAGVARRTSRRTTRRQVGYSTAYLPTGYDSVNVGPSTYYTCDGDYYSFDEGSKQYTVVSPPIGATVKELPAGAALAPNSMSVYVFNGVYYRPTYENGVVVYMVTNP